MNRKPSPATVISLVALFFSLTGAGLAATGYRITSLWQISPKVRHALRGRTGPPGRQGMQGVAGLRGLPGAPGPAGDPGTPAPSRSSGFTDSYNDPVANASLTTASPTATVYANCPGGEHATGGGFQGENEIVTRSTALPDLPSQWLVSAHLDPSSTSGFVQAWAICSS